MRAFLVDLKASGATHLVLCSEGGGPPPRERGRVSRSPDEYPGLDACAPQTWVAFYEEGGSTERNFGAVVWRALDAQARADEARTLAHAEQPEASTGLAFGLSVAST